MPKEAAFLPIIFEAMSPDPYLAHLITEPLKLTKQRERGKVRLMSFHATQEVLKAFNQSGDEADYQAQLAALVQKGRAGIKKIKAVRPALHKHVNDLVQKGVVTDAFREHAVLDFDLDLNEQNASNLKRLAQKTLLVRRGLFAGQDTPEQRGHKADRLRRVGIIKY